MIGRRNSEKLAEKLDDARQELRVLETRLTVEDVEENVTGWRAHALGMVRARVQSVPAMAGSRPPSEVSGHTYLRETLADLAILHVLSSGEFAEAFHAAAAEAAGELIPRQERAEGMKRLRAEIPKLEHDLERARAKEEVDQARARLAEVERAGVGE